MTRINLCCSIQNEALQVLRGQNRNDGAIVVDDAKCSKEYVYAFKT